MFKHVVITGASSGIGAALAKIYSGSETRLSLIARGLERLERVADTCRANGGKVEAHTGDVQDAAGMESWLLACDAAQPIDLIIASAGLGGAAVMASKFGEPEDIAQRVISVNTIGVINTVTPLFRRFIERRAGHIVIISSVGAFFGLPDCPSYNASKAAIRIYGHGLRRLLSPHNVRVTIVYPGFIDTPMSQSLPFHPPFLWSAERAAAHICRGIERGRSEIVFPWQWRIAVRAVLLLPIGLLDRVLARSRVGA